MSYLNVKYASVKAVLSMAFFTLLACLLLFSLDKDTHSLMDLLKPGNLIALLLYFLPAWLLSQLFYKMLARKYPGRKGLALAISSGLVVGFTLVICCFLYL